MTKVHSWSLILVVIPAIFILARTGTAAAENPFPVCIGLKPGGLGSASIELTLSVAPYGPFVHLVGQGRFSQAIAPPNSLVIYSVSGTAIPNSEGWWISLEGAGYDLAKTIYRGTFAIQSNADPSKNSLSYTKQSLDGSSSSTFTGVPKMKPCP